MGESRSSSTRTAAGPAGAAWHSGGFPDIRPAWEQLFDDDPRATPFSSPAWSEAWLAHWSPGVDLRLMAVRDGGKLVGLAPMVLRRRGPLRVLRTMGEDPSDYWDVLAVQEKGQDVADAVASALRESADWDVAFLSHLPPDSWLPAALSDAGLNMRQWVLEPYPAIALPSTFEEYLASLPQTRRTNIRRRLRHLDDGEVQLRAIEAPADIPEAVGRWQELRVRQWRLRGRRLDAEHAGSRFRRFLTQALTEMATRGHVAFWEFRQGDQLVGSFISFVDERRFYQYLGGYDPAFGRLGIGKIAIAHGIRSSIESGRRCYDFLRGAEDYKYWYGAADQHCGAVIVSRPGLRSSAAEGLFRLRQRVRRSPQGFLDER